MKEVTPSQLDSFLGNTPTTPPPQTDGAGAIAPTPQNPIEQVTQITQTGNNALDQLNTLVSNLNQLVSNGSSLFQIFTGKRGKELDGVETPNTKQVDYKAIAQNQSTEKPKSYPVPTNVQAKNIHTHFAVILNTLDDSMTLSQLRKEWFESRKELSEQIEATLKVNEEKQCPPMKQEQELNMTESDLTPNADIVNSESSQPCKKSPNTTEDYKSSDLSTPKEQSKESQDKSVVTTEKTSRTSSSSVKDKKE